MKYFELKCKTYLKQDIAFQESFDVLSKFINFSMCQDEELERWHKKNTFKNYCFGNFFPVEKDKSYKKGHIYTFTLRSPNELFAKKLQTLLRENLHNPFLQVIEVQKRLQKQFFISELYSVTPVITSVKDETEKTIFWTMQRDGDIMKLQKQLQDNLEKKYQDFYGEELKPTQNFIQLLEVKNRMPLSIYFNKKLANSKHKKIRMFGNKFKIMLNEDELSQKLGFMALSCGLSEKQSVGAGFMLAKGL